MYCFRSGLTHPQGCQIERCKLPLKKKRKKKERQIAKRKEKVAKQRNQTIDVISTT